VETQSGFGHKIVSRPQLVEIRRSLRADGARVVFTNGCFDLLHRGHVEYLFESRALGDVLLVGLNGDESVRALKGPGHPLLPAADRAVLLAAMECVSYVTLFDETSVHDLVAELEPDILVKGGDYALRDVVGRRAVEQSGGTVRTVSLFRGASTSDLIQRIRGLEI